MMHKFCIWKRWQEGRPSCNHINAVKVARSKNPKGERAKLDTVEGGGFVQWLRFLEQNIMDLLFFRFFMAALHLLFVKCQFRYALLLTSTFRKTPVLLSYRWSRALSNPTPAPMQHSDSPTFPIAILRANKKRFRTGGTGIFVHSECVFLCNTAPQSTILPHLAKKSHFMSWTYLLTNLYFASLLPRLNQIPYSDHVTALASHAPFYILQWF